MGAAKKMKNTVEGTTIETEGNVTIGDSTTVNVYGFETNQGEIKFFARIFLGLLIFFAISAVVLVYWPNPEQQLASFFCGAFFALSLLFLIILMRSNRQASINLK